MRWVLFGGAKVKRLDMEVWVARILLAYLACDFPSSFLLAHKIAVGATIHSQTLKAPHTRLVRNGNIVKPTRATMKPAKILATMVAIFFISIFLSSPFSNTKVRMIPNGVDSEPLNVSDFLVF